MHIYVYGDSCSRELTNSLLALVHTDQVRKSYWKCYTHPRRIRPDRKAAFEANPQCGGSDTPASHSPHRATCTYSSKYKFNPNKCSAQFDAGAANCSKLHDCRTFDGYNASECGFGSDGPGFDFELCGWPTNFSEAVLTHSATALEPAATLRISFQFKTYLVNAQDEIVFSRLRANPPDVLVIAGSSIWGVAPHRRRTLNATLESEMLSFTSHAIEAVRHMRGTRLVWVEPLLEMHGHDRDSKMTEPGIDSAAMQAVCGPARNALAKAGVRVVGWPRVEPEQQEAADAFTRCIYTLTHEQNHESKSSRTRMHEFANACGCRAGGFLHEHDAALEFDGHCHAGTVMDVRAEHLARVLFDPECAASPL